MRRKSERSATKKTQSSPEKKVEKVKRTRASRRRKQSTSSENESAEEGSPERVAVIVPVEAPEPPVTPVKEVSPEGEQEQVWHVKTPQGAGESGEIVKLKICLARPPSTPERAERSPRSKRKQSRATSSSDTPSVEGVDEKRKTRHRSKKSTRGSIETERSPESHNEDQDKHELESLAEKVECDTLQTSHLKHESQTDDAAVSTTEENTNDSSVLSVDADIEDKLCADKEPKDVKETELVADCTVTSSKQTQQQEKASESANTSQNDVDQNKIKKQEDKSDEKTTEEQKSESETKSEDVEMVEQKEKNRDAEESSVPAPSDEVSIIEEKAFPEEGASSSTEDVKATNDHDVLELEPSQFDRERKMSTDSHKEQDLDSHERFRRRQYNKSESTQSTNEETTHNGEVAPPIVVNRRRKWGSRPKKVTSQKSITISSDVLKDIIPDVKPVEFNEVIEEKKHPKRIDLTEKVHRPVLPKIVIDNTEHIELKKNQEEKYDVKIKESLPMTNRRISVVKENDKISERPPSPPRNRQSCILYITNLVRPFTLPQLKNLLQRTGRIAENGFWIDKIKSKCYVKYENEDQAVETRHALHGVTWPVSNPKTLQVDFSSDDAFDRARNEDTENVPTSTIPGTVEDWLREQDMKRERGDVEKPWERKVAVREWDMGKGVSGEAARGAAAPALLPAADRRRGRNDGLDRSPEPIKKFMKKEEEPPAKMLDDLFRKTKATPCIYWLPLSDETIAVKEEQRRQHMAEHERRMEELRRRRH